MAGFSNQGMESEIEINLLPWVIFDETLRNWFLSRTLFLALRQIKDKRDSVGYSYAPNKALSERRITKDLSLVLLRKSTQHWLSRQQSPCPGQSFCFWNSSNVFVVFSTTALEDKTEHFSIRQVKIFLWGSKF